MTIAALVALAALLGLLEFTRRHVDAWTEICHALHMSSSSSLSEVLETIDVLMGRKTK